MILCDFECPSGHITERLADSSQPNVVCSCCGQVARRIISFRSAYREDAPWLESVLEVVDKDSTRPETRAFLAHPSRKNRENWMKAEGLREMCEGEKPIQRREPDYGKIADTLMKRHCERKALRIW